MSATSLKSVYDVLYVESPILNRAPEGRGTGLGKFATLSDAKLEAEKHYSTVVMGTAALEWEDNNRGGSLAYFGNGHYIVLRSDQAR